MIGLVLRGIVLLLLGAAVFLLVGPPAVLGRWLGKELDFLLVPLLAFLGLQLVALLTPHLLRGRLPQLGKLIGGGAWAWLAFYAADTLPAVAALLSDSGALPSVIRRGLDTIARFLTPSRTRAFAVGASTLVGLGFVRSWLRRPALRPTVAALVLLECLHLVLSFGVVFSLLARGWLLSSLWDLDLSLLVPPLACALVLTGAGRIVEQVRPGREMTTVASLLRTVASILLVGWVLYYVPTLAHRLGESDLVPGGMSGVTDLLDRIWHWSYTVGGVSLAAYLGLRRVFALWEVERAPRWIGLAGPAVRAGLILVVGMVLRTLLNSLVPTWQPASGLSQVALWGTVAMVVSALLGYFRGITNPLVSGFARWVSGSLVKSFIIGGLVATYVAFVRTPLFDVFRYAAFLEWFIIVVVAWRLLVTVREASGQVYTEQIRTLSYGQWRKHTQEVGAREDLQLSEVQGALRWFVEDGLKEDLLVLVVDALTAKGLARYRVARLIHRLLQYQDRPIPFLTLPWERRRIIRRNREARQALLEETVELLGLPSQAFEEISAGERAR